MAPQQDSFMDDSDDSCPLCVEEFDLSDRSFRPCPCGYQVCQFCYNNIKNNMNGLCPACRRQYDDKNIQWKVISPEEAKADVAAQARKKAAARQKEAERRQVETLNRKHLAGLRVVQKNLVYVVGMNIAGSNDDILHTLRGPNHFGQYGDIIKIVVSKAKHENASGQPLGIYVTFVHKEDAATCISALDGQQHEGRTLRAQYGTTKYCSAYLRNEKCNNRQCMFLHETGEDSDSFSRQDLSSLNALSTQRKSDNSHNASQHQAPPQQAPQHMAAASQGGGPKSEAMSRSDSGEGSALPATASWANNPQNPQNRQVEQSRRSSQAASRMTPSPVITQAKPITRPQSRAAQVAQPSEVKGRIKGETSKVEDTDSTAQPSTERDPAKPEGLVRLEKAIRTVAESTFAWSLDRSLYDSEALAIIDNFPLLVDRNGGAIRLALKLRQEQEQSKQEEERKAQALAAVDEEENFTSGSLQLGGEPETNDQSTHGRRQAGVQLSNPQSYDAHNSSIGSEFAALSLSGRSLTPQQQRNIALLKNNTGADAYPSQIPRSAGSTSQHQPQLSNPFQSQNQQLNTLSRHGRQSSRYSFANDSASASTNVKPATNAQLLAQQSAMMPPSQQKSFASQAPLQPSLYSNNYSNIQGPPPGLKSSGTPPISGGGMFGQGHGFASAMGGSLGYGGNNMGMKGGNSNEDLVRDIIRGRAGLGGASENSKLDIADPSILQARMHHNGVNQGSFGGAQGQDPFLDDMISTPFATQDRRHTPNLINTLIKDKSTQSRSGTPSAPPGLSLQNDFPPLSASSKTPSRQNSVTLEAPLGETKRAIRPVLPAVPSLPSRSSTPRRQITDNKDEYHNTVDPPDALLDSNSQLVHDRPLPHAHEPSMSSAEPEGLLSSATTNVKESKSSNSKTSIAVRKKRQPPGILDIGAAKESDQKQFETASSTVESPKPITPKRGANAHIASSSSQPQTPAASPAIRRAGTIRVTTTSKAEMPPPASQATSAVSAVPMKQTSRQASIASMNLPETPVNDANSDNVSLTSASVSRPASPHLGSKVGTAPVRQKTKSQAKKDRQARAKAEETKIIETTKIEEEPVQAPIVGRKKKTKKQRSQDHQLSSQSKPASPTTKADTVDAEGAKAIQTGIRDQIPSQELQAETTNEAREPLNAQEADDNNGRESSQYSMKNSFDPASIIASMVADGTVAMQELECFLNPPSLNQRVDSGKYGILEDNPFEAIRDDKQHDLEEGEPVMMQLSEQEYAVVMPDRTVLRYLSKHEAERYVSLRKSVTWKDPDWFANTHLPVCMTLEDPWQELSAYGPAPTTNDLMFSPSANEISQMYGLSLLRSNGQASPEEPWEPPQHVVNEGLAVQMETMKLDDAERALRTPEENMVSIARKDADTAEKRLKELLKKNKKLLRDITELKDGS